MDAVLQLIEEYRHHRIARRDFFARLLALTGSLGAAHLLLERSGLADVLSAMESEMANLNSSSVRYPGDGVELQGYLSQPPSGGPYPGIMILHENRGLNEHIRDVTRRFAAQNYVALAPDVLSRKGGTGAQASPDAARDAIGTLTDDQVLQDLRASYEHLRSVAAVRKDRIGVVGFCWGGARSFLVATDNPNLRAAVVFYGTTPSREGLQKIACPVLGIYGEKDERITSKVPETDQAMKELGKSFEYKIYPGAQHAFFNDTNPERHDPEASKDAWTRTLAFFRKHLG